MKKGKVRGDRAFEVGVVISDRMDKTAVVRVKTTSSHKTYKRIVHSATKYKVHDEKNEARAGDTVRIMQTRPLSREKRWRLIEVLKKQDIKEER